MKINFKTLIILALFVFISSCTNKKVKDQEATITIESKSETIHNENEVSLDDGKRWSANSETTEGINTMIQLMDSFTEMNSEEAYSTLTDSLDSEFNLVFKRCTMKGEAHNQLHNYLFPMKATFKKLSSTNLDESKAAFDELKMHLSEYKNYFE